MKLSTLVLLTTLTTLSACMPGERIAHVRPVHAGTPRDEHALTAVAAANRPEAAAWEDASRRALRSGLSVATTFHERIRFPADEAHAIAYRLSLASGQTVRVRIDAPAGERIFADVFQPITDDMFRHVFAPRDAQEFEFRAPIAGEYTLRLQPPIDAGGLFDVTVTSDIALLFPVAGGNTAAIGGVFGDARDGGARAHEGVDIFAPRGTPVVAVTAGRVHGVRTTPTGGRVVWLSDDVRTLTYYYAHLEEQRVHDGMFVNVGDTLGTVGTSGNAAGVSPHLHFGIYRPGTIAVDPAPYFADALATAPYIDNALLGQRVQLASDRVRLRSSPSRGAPVVAELHDGTALLVLGAIGEWHRVVLSDGTTGFVAARFTTPQSGAR